MADIVISKFYKGEKAVLSAVSVTGTNWIEQNMVTQVGWKNVVIDKEHVEDMIKQIEADGLDVDSQI